MKKHYIEFYHSGKPIGEGYINTPDWLMDLVSDGEFEDELDALNYFLFEEILLKLVDKGDSDVLP